MKTPMQELYSEMEKLKKINNTIAITDIQRMIGNYYIDKEKEIIEESHLKGIQWGSENEISFEDLYSKKYFNETFDNE